RARGACPAFPYATLFRSGVGTALLAVPPVLLGELPGLQGIALTPLEPLQLLLVRDVKPEFDEDHPLEGQGPLESDYLAVRPLPRSEEHTSELQSPCNLVC